MGHLKLDLNQANLLCKNNLDNLVENKTTFTMNNCEFSIYETHTNAYEVELDFETLAYTAMLRGKKIMKIEGKSDYFDYAPGESVLMAPGEKMIINFPEADQTPTQCISLSFNPTFLENAVENLNLLSPKVDETSKWNIAMDQFFLFQTPSLTSATNNILRIAMDDNSQKDVMADFALKELLIRIMQTHGRNLIENNLLKNKSRIAFVTDYIKKNIHQKLSVESIAKMAYVSKSNFFKMFKQELGISPNEYILQERINKAKALLKLKLSIKEVAYQTGFSDTNYFTRVFKQYAGTTPKLFQQTI